MVYNPEKLVDVMNLAKNGVIDGENESGLAYTLEDLINWSSEYVEEGASYGDNDVVVCEKPDGTYHYYYMSEFKSLVEDNKLRMEVEGMTSEDFMQQLENGYFTSGYYNSMAIKNADGDTEYTDCWTFSEALREKYTPAGAANILEVVNKSPELNGKLSRVYGLSLIHI